MTDVLWDALAEPVTNIHFQKALLGASLSAIACGVVGCFIVLRRMAFLGDALSHAMLAGVTAGYLFMEVVFDIDAAAPAMIAGALVAGLVTVAAISFVSQVSRIKDDTAIGIMYTGMFALGGILASVYSDRIHIHLYDFIVGMVLAVEDGHLWMIAIVASCVLSTVILLFRHLQITTFDPIMAASIGIPVVAMHYLLTACTSLVVVSAVPVVGVVLVVGLLITPAATAYLLTDRLSRMLWLSPAFGVSSVLIGLYLSTWIGTVATGPLIVLVSTLQFLGVLTASPRYGLIGDWLRRRQLVPQQVVEDGIGCIRRGDGRPVPSADVAKYVTASLDQVRRAIHSLQRGQLLEKVPGGLVLTDAGRHEARRLMRSHRLWETYLQHVGMPDHAVHAQAHQLEHLHDEQTVDYLDNKLGHPLQDPHGAEIPEDFVHLVPGAEVKASLLREGHLGTITSLGPAANHTELQLGMQITAGLRTDSGKTWTFILTDGQSVTLDHLAADAIQVRLEPQ